MYISGSVQHLSEPIFLSIVSFQTYWSLEPLNSTPGGGRRTRSRTFLYEIQFWTTFIWSSFLYNAYLCQHLALKWTISLISHLM